MPDARDELLHLSMAWLEGGTYDIAEVERLHRLAAVGMHERSYRRIASYARLAEECGTIESRDADEIWSEMLSGEGAFKSYGSMTLAEDDFHALTAWLADIAAYRPAPEAAAATSLDAWMATLDEHGLAISMSSGTSGRPSLVPRDLVTRAYAAALEAEWRGRWLQVDISAMHAALLAVRRGYGGLSQFASAIAQLANRAAFLFEDRTEEYRGRAFERMAAFLRSAAASGAPALVVGPPLAVHELCVYVESCSERIDLAPGSALMLGGGWKGVGSAGEGPTALIPRVWERLAIPPERVTDAYSMVECNAVMHSCRAGAFHIPPHLWPMIVDDGLRPLPVPRSGRFAFSDPLTLTTSGFFATGDAVTLETAFCPCGRTGFTLVDGINRCIAAETRGCGTTFLETHHDDS